MFNGSYVALITPFTDGQLDEPALKKLVQFHVENGTHGLVPVGTTGESPTLSEFEHQRVIEIVVNEVGGKIPVVAGAGSNNTAEAIAYHRFAAGIGADATLHITGYYNKPNAEGHFRHIEAVAASADLPIIVYNNPPRTGVDITPQTLARMATLPGVVGIKDATHDLSRPLREQALIDKPFSWLSGEDPTAVSYNAQGGNGCISVTANVAPALSAQMQEACLAGDYEAAREIQRRLMPLHQALFLEPSPAGVKYAASRLGLCRAECRLPMVPLADDARQKIDDAMASLGLVKTA